MPISNRHRLTLAASALIVAAGWVVAATAVPQGSPEKARLYYQAIAGTLGFRNEKTILDSTLDDVPRYLGYGGLSGRDLERLPSDVLMDPTVLARPCAAPGAPAAGCDTAVEDPAALARTFGVLPIRAGDILSSRFLAPKIANVSESAATRALGWRKLVRLRARSGSAASKHGISAAVLLFNFFTGPGTRPFAADGESVNTQVMLLTTRGAFASGTRKRDSLYWLDYGPLSAGGKISLQLDATFDASDLQGSSAAVKPYYVPDGCVACHGDNATRPMVNYLDTDHWFDRLDDDFARVRDEGLPVLFDGGPDTSQPAFVRAFDVIRQFNEEAEAHAGMAQPRSFHLIAGRTWLRLHQDTNEHVPPIRRAVPSAMRWNPASSDDLELLGLLNRYCFRCHGTIGFNVFDRSEVFARRAPMATRLNPTAAQIKAGLAPMPPDRKLDDQERDRLRRLLRAMEK